MKAEWLRRLWQWNPGGIAWIALMGSALALFVSGISIGFIYRTSFEKVVTPSVVSREIRLVSEDGRYAMYLTSTGLHMELDAKVRANFMVAPDGHPMFSLLNEMERRRVAIDLLPTGVAAVALFDDGGKEWGEFTIDSDGSPRFILTDGPRQVRVELSPHGPYIMLNDGIHKAIVITPQLAETLVSLP